MVEQTQLGLLGNLNNTLANLSLPGRLGLLSTGVSLLEGQPIGQAVQTGLGTFGGLQQIEEDKKRREAIQGLLATGGFTNTEKSLITASSNPVATALSIRNSKQPKGTDATALMKNFAFLKKLNPNASDEEILKSIRGGTTQNFNLPDSRVIGDYIYSKGADGQITARVIEGSPSALKQEAAKKKLDTLEEKEELKKESQQETGKIVTDEIERAQKLVKENPFLTTGIIGKNLKDLGAIEFLAPIFGKEDLNPATDLKNLLMTIQSIIGFERLDRMRQESPTGGALGQVAIKELDFLQAALGSLQQEQSSKQLLENLKRLDEKYKSFLKNLATSKEVDAEGRTGIEYLKFYGFSDADIASATGGGATGELGVDYIDGLSEEQLLRVDPLNDNLSDEAFDQYMKRRYKQ